MGSCWKLHRPLFLYIFLFIGILWVFLHHSFTLPMEANVCVVSQCLSEKRGVGWLTGSDWAGIRKRRPPMFFGLLPLARYLRRNIKKINDVSVGFFVFRYRVQRSIGMLFFSPIDFFCAIFQEVFLASYFLLSAVWWSTRTGPTTRGNGMPIRSTGTVRRHHSVEVVPKYFLQRGIAFERYIDVLVLVNSQLYLVLMFSNRKDSTNPYWLNFVEFLIFGDIILNKSICQNWCPLGCVWICFEPT